MNEPLHLNRDAGVSMMQMTESVTATSKQSDEGFEDMLKVGEPTETAAEGQLEETAVSTSMASMAARTLIKALGTRKLGILLSLLAVSPVFRLFSNVHQLGRQYRRRYRLHVLSVASLASEGDYQVRSMGSHESAHDRRATLVDAIVSERGDGAHQPRSFAPRRGRADRV